MGLFGKKDLYEQCFDCFDQEVAVLIKLGYRPKEIKNIIRNVITEICQEQSFEMILENKELICQRLQKQIDFAKKAIHSLDAV